MVVTLDVTISGTRVLCFRHIIVPLVPKYYLQTMWSRPEWCHFFPDICSLNPLLPTAPYKGALKLAKIVEKTQALMGYTKNTIFLWYRISKFLCPVQRYNDFKLIRIICQAACHGKTEHGIFVKFQKPSKTAVVLIASVTISGTLCRVLRVLGTSSYHLVPKHLLATWSRPEQSHLLPEACSPNGTDNRQQRQRRTKLPPPEPSNILKRFHALYDDKLRNFKKKVSKLYYLFNPFMPTAPHKGALKLAKIAEKT